jgi:hypothetical protein
MRLPAGDSAQNERNRQIEKADRENVKKSRKNYIDGKLLLQSPDGTWWTLAVDNAGNVTAS